jgi:hypothetical protein
MTRLSVNEQRELDILIRDLKLKYEALDCGAKEMSPTVRSYILDISRIIFLLYEKTDGYK